MVRYRDNKVVSIKGERYTEIKKEEATELKKTYVHIKPGKQYRFHWSTRNKPYLVTAAQPFCMGGVAGCPGQGGKVCLCQGYGSCSCHKCGMFKVGRGHLWGPGRSTTAWLCIVCFVVRILFTLRCCLLVSASDCIDVCNFLVLLMLTRYQRIRRPFIITLYCKNNRVRKKIDLKIPPVILSLSVRSQPLDLGHFYTGTVNSLSDKAHVKLDILWYVTVTYKQLICEIFSALGIFITKYKSAYSLFRKGFVL